MEKDNRTKTGVLPVCSFEGEHPEMLIKMPERDKRLDAPSQSAYCEDTQTYD